MCIIMCISLCADLLARARTHLANKPDCDLFNIRLKGTKKVQHLGPSELQDPWDICCLQGFSGCFFYQRCGVVCMGC